MFFCDVIVILSGDRVSFGLPRQNVFEGEYCVVRVRFSPPKWLWRVFLL